MEITHSTWNNIFFENVFQQQKRRGERNYDLYPPLSFHIPYFTHITHPPSMSSISYFTHIIAGRSSRNHPLILKAILHVKIFRAQR